MFGLRPSEILDPDHELPDMDRIYLDYLISIARSEEASKTMSGEEYEAYVRKVEELKKRYNRY